MITYIVYEESESYQLGNQLFLHQQYSGGGESFFVEQPEKPEELPGLLDNQPLKQLSGEWRVIFLDCSQAYTCENPYESEAYRERFQYIEDFLSACIRRSGGSAGRRITRFAPEAVYCMALRAGLYFHTEEEGYLYSDFAAARGNAYRYLIFDVGGEEPKLKESTLFEVLCTILTLAMNEFPGAMLEAGYLYQCRIGIDEEKLSEYIGDMEETRRYIRTLLYKERQLGEGTLNSDVEATAVVGYVEELEKLQEMEESLELGAKASHGAGRMVLFGKERFPFAAADNVEELSGFRMRNIRAIQRLGELSSHPERWWEDGEKELFTEEPLENRLSDAELSGLVGKRRACAESIFKESLPARKLEGQLGKSRELLADTEQRLLSRMTKKSAGFLLKEGVGGLAVIGVAYGILTAAGAARGGNVLISWLVAALYLFFAMACFTFALAGERGRALRRLNRSLKRTELSFGEAGKAYQRLQRRMDVHRGYSARERQQRYLMCADRERQEILLAYERLLAQSEANIQQLLWIFGKEPVTRKDIQNRAAVDFSVYPSETICTYMPHHRETYDLLMEGSGFLVYVPFSFLGSFEIKRVFLPYSGGCRAEESWDDNTDREGA